MSDDTLTDAEIIEIAEIIESWVAQVQRSERMAS